MDEIKSLHELGAGTDKATSHQYLEIYEGFFEPIRNKVKRVLEIGIYDGASHRLWRDYFPKAEIFGIDVDDRNANLGDRITPFYCDAYTPGAVELFDSKFDVIIDDGPHTLESMVFCVSEYTKLLAPNGILVIEDIPIFEWIYTISNHVPAELQRWAFGIDRRFAPVPTEKSFYRDEIMFVIDCRFASV